MTVNVMCHICGLYSLCLLYPVHGYSLVYSRGRVDCILSNMSSTGLKKAQIAECQKQKEEENGKVQF